MNTISAALKSFLDAAPTIAVYVGGSGASPVTTSRIYPIKGEQGGDLPSLTYAVVSGESEITLGGKPAANAINTSAELGLAYKRIQINVWAKSSTIAEQIIEALRLLLAGYKGLWADVNVSVVGFNFGPDQYEEDTKIYHFMCQISVWHEVPLP